MPVHTQPYLVLIATIWGGLPGDSVVKKSACNAGDPGSIPRFGRSSGKGIGYPLQYSRASLVSQLVKNLTAMWETLLQSLGCEGPLEKGKATHSSILAWRIPWAIIYGLQRVGHDWATCTVTQLGFKPSLCPELIFSLEYTLFLIACCEKKEWHGEVTWKQQLWNPNTWGSVNKR